VITCRQGRDNDGKCVNEIKRFHFAVVYELRWEVHEGEGSRYCGLHSCEISAPPPYLGKDHDKNGFGEKRGRIRVSTFCGRRMGERYGARVGKRKSAEVLRARECGSRDNESRQRVRKTV